MYKKKLSNLNVEVFNTLLKTTPDFLNSIEFGIVLLYDPSHNMSTEYYISHESTSVSYKSIEEAIRNLNLLNVTNVTKDRLNLDYITGKPDIINTLETNTIFEIDSSWMDESTVVPFNIVMGFIKYRENIFPTSLTDKATDFITSTRKLIISINTDIFDDVHFTISNTEKE